MKHRIICKSLEDGRERIFTYENLSNEVCELKDGREEPVDFLALNPVLATSERLSKFVPVLAYAATNETFREDNTSSYLEGGSENGDFGFCKDQPLVGKSRHLVKLAIQFGLACNYRCTYCLQAEHRQGNIKVPSKETIDTFLRKFDAAGLEMAPNGLVDLWGGEPLVYWSAVKYLTRKLRARFPVDTRCSLFTNGVLLDDEKIDFLNRWRVQVHISHDGPGFVLRDKEDPLFNPAIRDVWMRLYRTSTAIGLPMGFFPTITPLTCDIFALRRFFAEHFDPDVLFHFGGALGESESLSDECIMSRENAETFRASVLKAVTKEPGKWTGLERRVFNLMGAIIHRSPSDRVRYHCNAADDRVLSVNLNGDVLSCQNRSAAVAAIGSMDDYDGIVNTRFTHWSRRPYCRDCLVLHACKGSCPDLSDEALTRCCTNTWAFHYAMFAAAWHLLTGTVLEDVSPRPFFAPDFALGQGESLTQFTESLRRIPIVPGRVPAEEVRSSSHTHDRAHAQANELAHAAAHPHPHLSSS